MFIDVISHVVLDDKFFYNEKGEKIRVSMAELGGPVSYVSLISSLFPLKYNLITSYGQDVRYERFFSALKSIHLNIVPSKVTTKFEHHIYPTHREMYVKSVAKKLDEIALKVKKGNSCLISPVLHEVSSLTLKELREDYEFVAVDIQGFLRELVENKVVFVENKHEIEWILNNVDVVKFSLSEAKAYTRENTIKKIFAALHGDATKIITAGKDGTYYEFEGRLYYLPAVKSIEADPTGAGDVFMGALVSSYVLKKDIEKAIALGMVLAAEKVKYQGIQPLPKKDYLKKAELLEEKKKELT